MNRFEQVDGTCAHMKTISDLFQNTIAPLYGDQTDALKKIAEAKDRLSYLLLNENGNALGVLVFKRISSQEFETLGINKAIELKTLFVVDAGKNSGVGLGSQLLKQCLEYAESINAENIVVTVSEEKPESLKFFERKGFKKISAMQDKYKNGITEFILAKSLITQ